MDRNKFIDDLIDAGANDDEIVEALKLAESRNEFKPIVGTHSQQVATLETKPTQHVSHETTTGEALFPRVSKAEKSGKGSKVVGGILDVASMPFRAGAAGIGKIAEMLGAGSALSKEDIGKLDKSRYENIFGGGESFKKSMARTGGREGAGTVENIAEDIVRDPANVTLLASWGLTALPKILKGAGIVGKVAPIAAETAASVAAHQGEHVAKGEKIKPSEAAIESLVGLGVPLAAKGITKGINKMAGRAAEQLSGVSESTLRAYPGKKAAIQAASGKQKEIGEKLLDVVDNWWDRSPEMGKINEAVKNMPDIPVEGIIKSLNNSKVGGKLSHSLATNKKIDDLINEIVTIAPSGSIPAEQFLMLRRELDELVGDSFGKEANKFITAVKQARHTAMTDLVKSAETSGNTEYITNMENLAKKLKAIENIKRVVGKSANTREMRVESFIDNLFGRNKEGRRELVSSLDELFGENILEESKLAYMAKELGPEGKPTLFPRQTTGRSALGLRMGGIGGGGLGMLSYYMNKPGLIPLAVAAGSVPAVMSSPALTSKYILPALSGAENVAGKLAEEGVNPAIIRQLMRNVSNGNQ